MSARLVSVAVPVPALGLLSYRVPDGQPTPPPGARVVVPLGHQVLTGVVVGAAPPPDASIELRELRQVLDAGAFMPPDVVRLTAWVADYYLAGPGAALSAALPPGGLTARVDAFKTTRLFALTSAGRDVLDRLQTSPRCIGPDDGGAPRFGRRQREALELLAGAARGMAAAALLRRGISAATVSRLAAQGFVSVQQARVDRDPFGGESEPGSAPPTLTGEQQRALASLGTLADAERFHVALLHGVTGSGKTELYLQLAERVRRRGRGVLVLVPEIALTPQVAAVFRARFGAQVAIQHSGLSDGERHDQWHRIRRGDVDVVIGTRSAIFSPLADIGLIVVDEEHDTSYKQDETPRYHGRDVAVVRGRLAEALVVLGSATPSMESYANAQRGRYRLVTLERRVLDRPLADVRIVNMREEMAEAGGEPVLSRALAEGLGRRLEQGEQSVILLNRRGFATSVFCRQCGHTLDCPNCSVSLTVHRRRGGWNGRCHYCNYVRAVPAACVRCASPYLEHAGFGTERVEDEVRARFPGARIARVDRDTVRRRGRLAALLGQVRRKLVDVLIGTQMIAKGHDFPEVTLVGVISADVGLGVADFRAAERTFQLLTQVAGRAGRGERPGEAIIQTLFPEHYSIQLARTQDYRAFFDKEIAFRQAMRYPPRIAMVNVVVRGSAFDAAMDGARRLAARVGSGDGFVLLGPAPAPLTKLRGEHRAQFFLKGTNRAAMRDALRSALTALPAIARRATVDVDPQSML